MHSLSRMTGWLVLAFAFALPAGAQQAPAPSDAVKGQQKRSVDQPGNNFEVWRDVRSGQSNSTSVPGREVGVLVQQQARFPGQENMTTAGEAWRKFRNGPITFYGGWLVVLVCAIIAAIYFAQGPIKLHDKPTGRMIERFTLAERWAHWVMGISFCVLGGSGLIILFGKHVLLPILGYTLFAWLTSLAKNLHNFVAPLFIVSLLRQHAAHRRAVETAAGADPVRSARHHRAAGADRRTRHCAERHQRPGDHHHRTATA